MPFTSSHQHKFVAPRWLASGHVQTLSAALPFWAPPRWFRPARVEALRLALPIGGALHAHAWWQAGRAPAAVLVHGVGGSSDSGYVVRAAVAFYHAGWHVTRIDLRGAGASIPDAPHLYHAGLTDDLSIGVEHVAHRADVSGVAVVGFSLGGHLSLRFAAELGGAPGERRTPGLLRAVAAISPPLDLAETARALERPFSRPYHVYVLRQLVRQARTFAALHPARSPVTASEIARIRSIREFDDRITAPMHGFRGAEDYYSRASAGPLLARVRIPTLVVQAADDPIVPARSVRRWLRDAPPCVEQIWTERGGHVGWFGGLSEKTWVRTWAIERALAFAGAFT